MSPFEVGDLITDNLAILPRSSDCIQQQDHFQLPLSVFAVDQIARCHLFEIDSSCGEITAGGQQSSLH
jgi:hypothetical protein